MKSNESDFLELAICIYKDAMARCSADISKEDLRTLRSRLENEGLSFLTITLPLFSRDLERGLENNGVDSTYFRPFRKNRYGLIPAFLQGIVSRIFDEETGRLLEDNEYDTPDGVPTHRCADFVEATRQFCLAFRKVELPCTPEREQAAINGYLQIEHDFKTFSVPEEEQRYFKAVSFMLWSRLVRTVVQTEFLPRHGPGATVENVLGNEKYSWQFWTERLEPYFPLVDFGFPLGIPSTSEELQKVTFLSEEEELPVKVILVPKTLKSPRVIAKEPAAMQYVQQALSRALVKELESDPVSAGHINFSDQSVNQVLAMTSSKDGQLATVDLSDASDRVPWSQVQEMFHWAPDFLELIDACRSRRAELPDGRVIGPLSKFASMGSALCFPIEAMYFYTVCVVALLRAHNLPVTRGNCESVSRELYVYGDDIIVPVANADTVLDHLRKYNCKVNANKTFVIGRFRESCGLDAFRGYEVTPTYVTRTRPKDRRQVSEVVSWVATANHFVRRGYWITATFMYEVLEGILGPLPYVDETSQALGRFSFRGYRSIERWNSRLHRFEINGWVPSPVHRTDDLEGYAALQKFFLASATEPLEKDQYPDVQVELSFERSALRGAVSLKRRWVTPS